HLSPRCPERQEPALLVFRQCGADASTALFHPVRHGRGAGGGCRGRLDRGRQRRSYPSGRRRAADHLALRRAPGRLERAMSGQRLGRVMLVLAWILGLWLATHFFGKWQQRQDNPNPAPISQHGQGFVEVHLAPNAQNHFVANGRINGQEVLLLLDTGATDVAIPAALAQTLKLTPGAPIALMTANGRSTGYRTQ